MTLLGDHVLRFAGLELDQQRAELRGADGVLIKLRPKTFEMLRLFATSGGRALSKQELMEAVWPNVHVGEDSLFQCIRELRTALGDEQRQLIKLASGAGYLLTAEVEDAPDVTADSETPPVVQPAGHGCRRGRTLRRHRRACGCRAGVEAGSRVSADAVPHRYDSDR